MSVDMGILLDDQYLAPPHGHRAKNIALGNNNNINNNNTKGGMKYLSVTTSQLTPPETPLVMEFSGLSDGVVIHDTNVSVRKSNSFHTFLRAFYPYHPASTISSGDDGESSVTVPINQGDIILVHSIQPNGWADGTLLTSGARGWLPTNYCEAYDHSTIRSLLDALTQVWEFIRGHEDSDPSVFVRQDYVRGMIAGVRLLLEQTKCLTRDAPLVTTNILCRRARRGILGELSTFVKAAKQLQETCQTHNQGDKLYDALDDIVLRAFKVTTRAVKFLDVWLQLTQIEERVDSRRAGASAKDSSPPSTPLTNNYDINNNIRTEDDYDENTHHTVHDTSSVDHDSTSDAYTYEDTTFVADDGGVELPSSPKQAVPMHVTASPSRVLSASEAAKPITSSRQQNKPRPLSIAQKRASASHRWSYSVKSPTITRTQDLASERLSSAHDTLLGSLGNLTGLHSHARSSLELFSRTQLAVTASQVLINILDEVSRRDAHGGKSLDDARDALERRVVALIQVTAKMPSFDDMDGTIPDHEQSIMEAVMLCVRSAGDCVAKTKLTLQHIGDFDMDEQQQALGTGLGISSVDVRAQEHKQHREQQQQPYRHQHQQVQTNQSYRSASTREDYEFVDKPLPLRPLENDASTASESDEVISQMITRPPPQRDSSLLISSSSALTPTTFGESVPRVSSETVVQRSLSVASSAKRSSYEPIRKLPSLDLEIPPISPITFPFSSSAPMSAREGAFPVNHAINSGLSDNGNNELQIERISIADSEDGDDGNAAETASSFMSNARHSESSTTRSEVSTVVTTPDDSPVQGHHSHELSQSFDSLAQSQSTLAATDEYEETETELMTTTYAHELTFNKDGQLTGGSLPALVERLTAHDMTPDAMFVNTFYMTFRLFCGPVELARCLADRFAYIGANPAIATPVRLRVYNVFKGWLEMHWRAETDSEALALIAALADGPLRDCIPTAGKKLFELVETATANAAAGTPARVVSLHGKTNTVIGSTVDLNTPPPAPAVTKSQLNLLKKCELKAATCSILDFDPLEIARQLTLMESKVFCKIATEELLASEWMKKVGSKGVNVKAKSTMSTNLANLVVDTILQYEEAKKRALIVKQWIKIAKRCRELNNYDSLMAIICSLNSSMIGRLKKTWELISDKTNKRLEELRFICDCARNFYNLRQLLVNHVAPCLPFVGTYLTDLTFVDVGNSTRRQVARNPQSPTDSPDPNDCIEVINFDKQVRTAKIIGDLQRFQIPFRLQLVPEMHDWLESEIGRMNNNEQATVANFYRRSCTLEPKQQVPQHQVSPSLQLQQQQKQLQQQQHQSKQSIGESPKTSFSTPNSSVITSSASFASTTGGSGGSTREGQTARERFFESWSSLHLSSHREKVVA